MNKSNQFLFLVVIICSGCAKLEVTVDILDPEVVREIAQNDYIQESMEVVLAEDRSSVDTLFEDLRDKHKNFYVAKSQSYLQEANNTADPVAKAALLVIARSLQPRFAQNINPIYDSRKNRWAVTADKIRNLYDAYLQSNDEIQKRSLRRQLIIQLESRRLMLQQLQNFVASDIGALPQDKDTPIESQIRQELISKSNALFDHGGLLESRYTFYVVKAPEENWAKYYDRSFGKGIFGNTDIAIKALGPGNFTIKGLSFNPADVANAASKVTTQTVLLAAQISGVPVNISGSPSGDGANLAKSSTRIAAAVSARDSVGIEIDSQREALLRLAQAIVNEKSGISGASIPDREEAIAAIKAIYDSQSTRLSITTPNE